MDIVKIAYKAGEIEVKKANRDLIKTPRNFLLRQTKSKGHELIPNERDDCRTLVLMRPNGGRVRSPPCT